MPAEPVRFHRLAAQEYRVASDWYRKRDASVADRFRNAVDFAINRLRSDPNSHEQIFDGIDSTSAISLFAHLRARSFRELADPGGGSCQTTLSILETSPITLPHSSGSGNKK